MNPLWIIDFTGSPGLISDFFYRYWEAHRTNIGNFKSEPWFIVSSIKDLGLEIENDTPWDEKTIIKKIDHVINIAKSLTVDFQGTPRMIKHVFTNVPNTLNVILIGDTQCLETQRFFNLLSMKLCERLLPPNPWTSIPNIFIYGFVYIRDNVSVDGGLSIEEKVFLHHLHNAALNFKPSRPFNNVLFFQSQERERADMLKTMSLAALHIGMGDENELRHYQEAGHDFPFLNAGVAGIFLEQSVQNEREAFLLGHALTDAFINNISSVFFRKDSAESYVNQLPIFTSELFSSAQISKEFTLDTPKVSIDEARFDPEIKPTSWRLKKVWMNYYNDFILNLKKNLVNKIRFEIMSVEEAYKEKIAENQYNWISAKTKAIEEGVFGIFKSDHPHPQCSILQAIEVADLCNKKVTDQQTAHETAKPQRIRNSNEIIDFDPFPLNQKFSKAFKTACESNKINDKAQINQTQVLELLESQLKHHPVFFLSMLLRAILIGLILIFVGIPLLKFLSPDAINLEFLTKNIYVLGFTLFLIPIVIMIWKCRQYTFRIKSLKDQYIAISIKNLNQRIVDFVSEAIKKSYEDVSEFCQWIKDKRLEEGLRKQLGVLPPPDFNFELFDHFQPLLVDNVKILEKSQFLLHPEENCPRENAPSMVSGIFKNQVILSSVPDLKVRLNSGDKKIAELTDQEKMELIHELMKEKAAIFHSIEETTALSKIKVTSSVSKALLLDVSGSMSGDPLNQLIKVVQEYKAKYGDQIRWVGFASEARLDKEVSGDIKKAEAECGGGTSYVPAFKKAKENLENGELQFDKLIMISDGGTCDIDEAIKIAMEMGKPVDVIFIGLSGGEDYLKKLADDTGGHYTNVDKVDDIEIEVRNGLEFVLKQGDTGNFEFWQLLKKGNIEGCARALRSFAERKMISSTYSIEELISKRGSDIGLQQWIVMAQASCSVDPGAKKMPMIIQLKSHDSITGISQATVREKLNRLRDINNYSKYPYPPEIIMSLMTLQELEAGIRDLHLSYNPKEDRQMCVGENDPFCSTFMTFLGGKRSLQNLCGQVITPNN